MNDIPVSSENNANIVARDDRSSPPAIDGDLERGLAYADIFVNRNYLIGLSDYPVAEPGELTASFSGIRMYKVERIVFNEKENNNDKLISVYSTLQSLGSSAVMIIDCNAEGLSFYVGTNSQSNASTAGVALEKSFEGNFPGSIIKSVKNSVIEQVLTEIIAPDSNVSKNIACVSIVPSERDEDKDKFVQGIEKFIDAMGNGEYTAVIIANPLSKPVLEERKRGLEELYSTISPYAGTSLTYGVNASRAVSKGNFRSFSSSLSKSVSNSTTLTKGENTSSTDSKTKGHGFGFGGFSMNKGSSSSTTSGYSASNSWANSVMEGNTDTNTDGSNTNETLTEGDSRMLNLNYENKSVKNIMEKIEEHLERIKQCECFGFWECSAYFVSKNVQTAVVAANTYKALMAGDKSSVENSFVNIWQSADGENSRRVLDYIGHCIHPRVELSVFPEFGSCIVTPGCMISGSELPILLGLPAHSVRGLTSVGMAEFGRNIYIEGGKASDKSIALGKVYHMGKEEESKVILDVNSLTSHCFITGSTGSGKSYTSYQILTQLVQKGIKFLVVEPAKGEYKKDLGGIEGLNVFCTNPYEYRMLKLNPFKFHDDIHILEHLERLIEIFSACWPLYAAMPAILKSSIERAYERCGWDIGNSLYFPNGREKYPTFLDILEILPKIINSSEYSADSKGDYIGSLVTRVKSLTVGTTGQVFCDCQDVPDSVLFDENTIVDLSRVGSSENKSLIMGILVLKINEYRSVTAKGSNLDLQHVTVLEEAHNLLKRTSTEQSQEGSNLVGKSVEMICNSIAEMRTYGEGFIIIDQSPTSVDIAAIKNTNTKIVMRLPELDDCEAMGNAMALNEEQIKEISKLSTGKAVVRQSNWLESVLTSVYRCTDSYKVKLQLLDRDELCRVKGELVVQLYTQYRAQQYDIAALKAVIESSDLTIHKKREIFASIDGILADRTVISKGEFAKIMLNFIGCKGLFTALPVSFEGIKVKAGEPMSGKVKSESCEWFRRFFESLDRYVFIADNSMKLKISRYLLLAMIKEYIEDDRFIFIYDAKFNIE